MRIEVKVTKADGEELNGPYLLRLAGWTEERYFKEAPEMQFVEFEDGELIVHSPVNVRHQRIVGFLSFLLRGYVESHDLGEVFNGPGVVRLRPGLAYEPDIFVVPGPQRDHLGEQYFAGAPALVTEVVSSGSRVHDLQTKAANYREHNVPEYWAVEPEQETLHRHILPPAPSAPYLVTAHGSGRLESEAMAGFWIDVNWLWAEPPPPQLECLERILGRQ